jgi:hypothetical protein
MTTQTDTEYQRREALMLAAVLRECAAAPLADRREAEANWRAAMRTPDLVAERVRWLLAGHYGYGAYRRAWNIAESPRMNRAVALGQMIAAIEWRCPPAHAARAWRSLAAADQNAVNDAILAAIPERDAGDRP